MLHRNDELENKKKEDLLKRFYDTDMKATNVQKKKEKELRMKHNEHLLKELDKEDNIKRMENLSELQRQKLQEKIAQDEMRRDIIQ